jgi:ABC-2 type transport system ATP-binding protein
LVTLDASGPAVETRRLTKIFQDRVVALSPTDLVVPRGSVFGLIGPNGAGKTTTFRMMIGLQRPTSGSVLVLGEHMHPDAANLRRRIGYLPTGPRFPATSTPIEHLRLVGDISRLTRSETDARIAVLLRDLDLLNAAGSRISSFSTGMVTRLGIAAALINDPEILIWDEPTSGLDPVGRRQVTDLIKQLGKTRTVIVSTHVLGDVDRVCDEVGLLYRGRLIYSGSLADMKRRVQTNVVQLELDGDVDKLLAHAATWETAVDLDWQAPILRVQISEGAPVPATLSQLFAMIAQEDVSLLSVNMGSDQMEDAFLRRLEEDRSGSILTGWGGETK